jgi:hypothetical protein
MNALDPTVAEFRERLKHQRTEKKRRLNAMNCKPNRAVIRENKLGTTPPKDVDGIATASRAAETSGRLSGR